MKIKSLQSNLKKAKHLFKETLGVKLQYEEVITKLTQDPIAGTITLDLIKATAGSKVINEEKKRAQEKLRAS